MLKLLSWDVFSHILLRIVWVFRLTNDKESMLIFLWSLPVGPKQVFCLFSRILSYLIIFMWIYTYGIRISIFILMVCCYRKLQPSNYVCYDLLFFLASDACLNFPSWIRDGYVMA